MENSTPLAAFDFSRHFPWTVAPSVTLEDATKRVLAYCTNPKSGWGVYDLAAVAARRAGSFDSVSPWSLLMANALNGQVTSGNVADFTLARRTEFASRLAAIPDDVDLAGMDAEAIEKVASACEFGFAGVWGPKITKVGALYRPRAIPVLDGYVAVAFGLSSEGFSAKAKQFGLNRSERILLTVRALARTLRDDKDLMTDLRREIEPAIPEISAVSDLRLIDIVIWTSQDDRTYRRSKKRNRWLEGTQKERIALDTFEPAPVPFAAILTGQAASRPRFRPPRRLTH